MRIPTNHQGLNGNGKITGFSYYKATGALLFHAECVIYSTINIILNTININMSINKIHSFAGLREKQIYRERETFYLEYSGNFSEQLLLTGVPEQDVFRTPSNIRHGAY